MYRLEWELEVLRRFTENQLNKQDQRRVMDSLDATDRLLTAKPLEIGESRNTPSQRVLIQAPIMLTINIDLRLQVVRIVDAKIL